MEQMIGQIIIGVLLAIVGLGVWRLQAVVVRNETHREVREGDKEKLQIKTIRLICSTFLLGEATAIAVKGGRLNGEMEKALNVAKTVKNEVEDFLQEQGIKKVI